MKVRYLAAQREILHAHAVAGGYLEPCVRTRPETKNLDQQTVRLVRHGGVLAELNLFCDLPVFIQCDCNRIAGECAYAVAAIGKNEVVVELSHGNAGAILANGEFARLTDRQRLGEHRSGCGDCNDQADDGGSDFHLCTTG